MNDFSLTVNQLRLLVLQVECFVVNQLVQVIDPRQLFRDIVLQGSRLGSQVGTLFALELVLVAKLVNFLCILPIPLSEVVQLVFKMLLLRTQLRVEVLMLA